MVLHLSYIHLDVRHRHHTAVIVLLARVWDALLPAVYASASCILSFSEQNQPLPAIKYSNRTSLLLCATISH